MCIHQLQNRTPQEFEKKNKLPLLNGFLGSVFGRTDFSRTFIFGPPDFFRGFSRRIISPRSCGKRCPEKSSRKIPGPGQVFYLSEIKEKAPKPSNSINPFFPGEDAQKIDLVNFLGGGGGGRNLVASP